MKPMRKDPYRVLEDPKHPETKEFVNAQNKLFQDYISSYPHRQALHGKITKMFDYERFGCPFKRGDAYYYFHNSGLQPQSVLFQQKTLKSEPSIFFDPNALSEDGTVSLNTYGFSKSGAYFAYGLSASGSDWVSIRVMRTADKKEVEEKPLEWAKFTRIAWTHDDEGFFYTRYPSPEDAKDKGTETECNRFAKVLFTILF
jgi:prolyl oligopeptidase